MTRTTGPILVTGAGGQVGRSVVEQLRATGAQVLASSRNPERLTVPAGVRTVQADLSRPETLPAALAGVRKVFLYTVPDGIDGFLAAARDAGVEHIVLLSSHTSQGDIPERAPLVAMHSAVEEPIAASGIPYTFLRPAHFATNILMWGWPEMIRADGVLRFPYPESHCDAIHEADVAAVAVAALTGTGHEGQGYFITGPESITQREQARLIGEATGRPVRFVELSEEQARKELTPYIPEWVQDAVFGHWRVSDGVPVPVTDLVEQITGRPPRSFAQWARDHVADFT
jgi:uncharacterized protein YbjT (DUF2867 family)